ncbi:hypothetical protein KHHGKMAE_1946 [Methylobacterium persicinum]|nr:hypothetical protein KHHGKMAE_1946 [Methylobacterium persicinum]
MEVRRPTRSPMRPKSHPPTGRMKNPTAKMPAVWRSWLVESPFGKKAGAK